MRYLLSILFIFSFSCFSQDAEKISSLSKPKFRRHFIEFAPIAFSYKNFFHTSLTHHLEYRFLITPSFYFRIGTTTVLFKKLDYTYSKDSEKMRFKLLNESFGEFSYQYSLNKLSDEKRRVNLLGMSMGYQFNQFGPRPYHPDFITVDSTSLGYRRWGGNQVHSFKVGISYQHISYSSEKERPTIKRRHFLQLSYLFGVGFQQTSFISSTTSATKAANLDNKAWSNRNGVCLEYSIESLFSKNFGILFGFSFTYIPLPQYKPNYQFFVPRGGEMIDPYLFSFRVGFTFQ